MLLIPTKLKESKIHGIGIHVEHFVPKDTELWRFTAEFDTRFTPEQILAFPDIVQAYLYKYTWKGKVSKLHCFTSDATRYLNHSTTPNIRIEYRVGEDELIMVANTNIQPGEELLVNYNDLEFSETEDLENVMDKIAERLHLTDELDPWLK